MELKLKRKLEDIYKIYGFELAKNYVSDKVIVFTLKTGYFDNADIVPLSETSSTDQAFKDFSATGYACTKRQFLDSSEAERQLFKGFFSVDSILHRLENDYIRFTTAIVSPIADDAKYEYINAPYKVNGKIGVETPANEILSRLKSNKPTLFLIEAAAGFGKTCTAYEIVHSLKEKGEYLPLFSELSRNRQARVFRYILLDEIDRTFPALSSRLVQAEMTNGRVITILDGFDELLRKTDDGNEFESREPMLETIGEFLTGNAKIVLTTRRTVLFEGDAFHTWIDKHSTDFDFVRIRLNEPRVSDWLPQSRFEALNKSDLNISNLANPVLLSYLRLISDDKFYSAIESPHELIDKYFEFMLERERKRQDLRIGIESQEKILESIADDMIEYSYTSEQRDYIVDHIQKVNSKIIDESLLSYPATERPTKEEIANKLASHALLDRSSREPNKIGFINEFVFGHFIAKNIIKAKEWINDDLRFIEPAIVSYQPRTADMKTTLWNKLSASTEFLSISNKIDISLRLKNCIDFELKDGEAEGLEIEKIEIGTLSIKNFQFNECIFKNCGFKLNNLSDVTFLNCKFYENKILEDISTGPVHLLGPIGDQEFIQNLLAALGPAPEEIQPDRQLSLEKFILEKFWPVGRETITHKHRPIKGLCANSGDYRPTELYEAISSLKKKNILLSPMRVSFVELNFNELQAIKDIISR
ncbi:MAG: hypothetical protein PHQ58_00245 [Rhodoferax sp.]|uniref:hypothetical protein n=1 Tax=Rhodoferax sp. TaxID=50421 RepID=UPI002613C22C|nr:hypothetical protein [Rhodoferax sp.]MDD2878839.1 hypothetical protein [Rhodoferax sp.]